MNYKGLIKDWESDDLFRFDVHDLTRKGLNAETLGFLSTVGLPTSAAPYLSFSEDSEKGIRSVFDIYETGENIHKCFLIIGSNGAGDPIHLDISNDCHVITLNHEEDFEPTFMNSSICELFQFLTLYKRFVDDVISVNGEDAFLDANFTDRQYEDLKKGMEAADSKALIPNTIWAQELELLSSNREYYQNQK